MWKTPFIAITPKSTRVVVPVRILSMGQIDTFKNYLNLIGLCAKLSVFDRGHM